MKHFARLLWFFAWALVFAAGCQREHGLSYAVCLVASCICWHKAFSAFDDLAA